jgi:DNA replication ATP-dependent helicase Dna2
VLHPGLLVSATAVGGSYTCARREVLNNRYASDGTCGPAVLGQALHDLFQEVLHERFGCQSGTADPRHVLRRHTDAMHAAGQTEAAVLPRLDKALPQFRDLVDKLSSSHEVGVERMGAKGKQRRNVQVEKVADIEDMYWSHKYGVKGQLDAVLRASDAARAGPVSVPFELKTGRKRNTVEHGAQVVCYTLMMAEKLNATPAYGLMHYADVNDNDGMKRGKMLCAKHASFDVRQKRSHEPLLGFCRSGNKSA